MGGGPKLYLILCKREPSLRKGQSEYSVRVFSTIVSIVCEYSERGLSSEDRGVFEWLVWSRPGNRSAQDYKIHWSQDTSSIENRNPARHPNVNTVSEMHVAPGI